jgi:hypothetical protein
VATPSLASAAMSGTLQLLFVDEALRSFLPSPDVILKAIAVGRKKAGNFPYILRPRGIHGGDHVEERLDRIGVCRLDQPDLVSELEFV